MDTQPLVSICIPTYNRASIVEKAIRSALAQSYCNIEVIVVDNASPDNTQEVVESINDNRLKFYKNQKNLGLFGNFNRCIELAKGKIIHILHSDDCIDPFFTETCVNFFTNHPNVVLTFTSAKIQSENSEIEISYAGKDRIFPAPEGFRRLLTERPFIICPSVMVKKSLYEEIGSYSLEFPYSADFYHWLTISQKYDIGFVKNAYLFYRQWEYSESFRHLFISPTGYLDTLKIFIRLIHDLGDDRPKYQNELNKALYRFIHDCIFAGFTRADAMKEFRASLFTGIAITAWSMINPESFTRMLFKVCYLPVILLTGFILGIAPFRMLVKKVFLKRASMY